MTPARRSLEVGIRFRGIATSRLSYGATAGWRTAWARGLEADSGARLSAAFGLGYQIDRRTWLGFDVSGGTARAGTLREQFVSGHIFAQRELNRKILATASFMTIARPASLYPATPLHDIRRLSDFGLGYRIKPSTFAQYVYSTSYGVTRGAHFVMLRYSFAFKKE
jgi:hypothetical protein